MQEETPKIEEKKEEKGVGRPTVMTEEVIGKLEEAFSNGGTDKEACFIAGIHPDTLYVYCKENPEFSERKEQLKEMIKYHAKTNIANAIKFDKSTSLSAWYLEKKSRKEFGQNVDVTSDGEKITGLQVEIVEAKREPAKAPENLPTEEIKKLDNGAVEIEIK